MKNFPLIFILAVSSTTSLRAAAPVLVYSPDRHFVVEWFDTDIGKPLGEMRSIILQELPHGDRPFSLVTSPRDTRAYWSADSKKCLIIDDPDDGCPRAWLFIAKDAGTQPNAISIDPLKPLMNHWDGSGPMWRTNITKVTWLDNETLDIRAWDNAGKYKITVKMNSPNQPIVQKQSDEPHD